MAQRRLFGCASKGTPEGICYGRDNETDNRYIPGLQLTSYQTGCIPQLLNCTLNTLNRLLPHAFKTAIEDIRDAGRRYSRQTGDILDRHLMEGFLFLFYHTFIPLVY